MRGLILSNLVVVVVVRWAGVRQVKRLLARPPFLARNSALVEQAAAAAHTLPLPLPALHTCVASCQPGSRLQSVRRSFSLR